MVVGACNPRAEEMKTGGPLGSLVNQPSLCGELGASESLSQSKNKQKLRWMTIEEQPRLSFGFHR